jgi:hypothetical protein
MRFRWPWLGFLCAIATAWGTLLVLLFLSGLLVRTAHFPASWAATAQLTLNCFELAAAGFVAGRVYRPSPLIAVSLFAATLLFVDFGDTMPLNVAWLLRLIRDASSDSRFLDSMLTTAGTHFLLFGSLIAGGMLSRPAERLLSLSVRG